MECGSRVSVGHTAGDSNKLPMSRKNHNFLNYFCHLYSWKVGFYQAHCVTAIKGLSAKAKKKPFVKKGYNQSKKWDHHHYSHLLSPKPFLCWRGSTISWKSRWFSWFNSYFDVSAHTKWPFFSSNQWPWESSKSWFFAIHVISVFCRRLKTQESALKWAKIRETVLGYIFVSYRIARHDFPSSFC